jgi:hypothetical protein
VVGRVTRETDYVATALDGIVGVLIVGTVTFVTIKVAELFGVSIAIGAPTIATIAFAAGVAFGGFLGIAAALRWPEAAVEIHDQLVTKREE